MIMKIKTKDLIGAALDWAVTKCLPNTGLSATHYWITTSDGDDDFLIPKYSTDWKHGGAIIEHEGIQLHVDELRTEWLGSCWGYPNCQYGPTPLIAAMRCFVAHKLGDEVEIPDELL